MENPNTLIVVIYMLTDLWFCLISIPLIKELIPPNRIYGFRTRTTLSNKDIWYNVNKYAGKDLFVAGLINFFSGFVVLGFKYRLSTKILTLIVVGFLAISVFVVVIRGLWYQHRLKKRIKLSNILES